MALSRRPTKKAGVGSEVIQPVIWVHLCSGKIVEVIGATGVRVTAKEVQLTDGDQVVASFDRRLVYYTRRDGDAPHNAA